jgi:hypothetical protein
MELKNYNKLIQWGTSRIGEWETPDLKHSLYEQGVPYAVTIIFHINTQIVNEK